MLSLWLKLINKLLVEIGIHVRVKFSDLRLETGDLVHELNRLSAEYLLPIVMIFVMVVLNGD